MKKATILFVLATIGLFLSCKKDKTSPPTPTSGYVVGKNQFIIKVDNDDREYFVHVPVAYNATTPTPVVFMLHGTSGDGNKFYNISGWKEVGEAENIITVFPSSWSYCIITSGQQNTTTKWNSQPAEWTFCAGQVPRNDMKFFNSIITELNTKFSIDNKKIYLVGFSNGSQMAGKCSVEMGDKFAAIVESAGSLYSTTPTVQTHFPVRKLPILFQKGNQDYGPGNTGTKAPMGSLSDLLTNPSSTLINGSIYNSAQTNVTNFGLNPAFTIAGDTNVVVTASYVSASGNSLNNFHVSLIKNLEHAYPNGINHPFRSAVANWAWLKQFSLP